MNPEKINWLAVVAAALSMFLLGGVWYSALLFGPLWRRINGFTEQQVRAFNHKRAFIGSVLFAIVMSTNLAIFLSGPDATLAWGITAGLLAGAGWVATGLSVTALFENRPWSYMLVNGGYHIVSFALMGAILGAWR
jgi:hypothetical protein